MAANAFAAASQPRRRSTRAQAEADAAARHRLDVIAASVSDVIRSAGGWLADRALAGWGVNVFVPDTEDAEPLRILGVTAHSLAEVPARCQESRRPTAVAVSADRAFKCHALRAAAVDDADTAEVFHSGVRRASGWRPRLAAVGSVAGLPPAAVWAPAR